ncbi:MAG: sodium/proline symporter [Lachnospiraceae bacterium]|nr:sodium/proline symporter [Lachnospiraceae bacterium]
MRQISINIVMVLYLALMLYIGFASNKKGSGKSVDEFYLGGRKIGPLVTAMSAEASDMSSYLLMGLPGLAYLTGICDVGWTIIGLAAGTYLNWLLVSKRLRRYSEKIGAITIPDFFSKRYHDERNILSCIAALVILIFFIPYTASGFKAIGTLFNSLFGIDYHVAMIVGGAVVVAYTVIGGFLAVSTTDLMQSIVMTFALIAIVLFGIGYAGGWDNVVANAQSLSGYLNMNAMYDPESGSAVHYGFLSVISTLAWGLGYFGMPHILLRFMAIRDERELTLSRRIASVWVVISMSVAVLIGVVGNAVSKNGLIPYLNSSADSETVVIQLANILSQRGVFFALIAGLVMAGILACTMSTADSQLLQASSSFSQNILQDFLHIKMEEKQAMRYARATVAVIAIIGILLAWNPNSSVFTIVSFAWAGFGAAFGPLMLFSLFWKRTTKAGAIAGMVSGGVMIFIWKFLIRPLGGAWNIYELLPAFIVSTVVILVVSLVTAKPEKQIVAEFESVNEK